MVKKDNFLAFLGHPMWLNNIKAGHNSQAEKDGATFASWDTSKKSKEHHELFNLLTLKTEFLGNLTQMGKDTF